MSEVDIASISEKDTQQNTTMVQKKFQKVT